MSSTPPAEPTPPSNGAPSTDPATNAENQPPTWLEVAPSLRMTTWALVGWMYLGTPIVLFLIIRNTSWHGSFYTEAVMPLLGFVAIPAVPIVLLIWRMRSLGRSHGQQGFASWAALVPLLSLPLILFLIGLEDVVADWAAEYWPPLRMAAVTNFLGSICLSALLNGGLVLGIARLGWSRGWASPRRLLWGWRCVYVGVAVLCLGIAALIPFMWYDNSSRQDKSVLGNTRQLAAAADQYYLENGVTTVASSNLVGATNYVKAVNLVAGETYPRYFTQGVTITVTNIAGLRTVTYAP